MTLSGDRHHEGLHLLTRKLLVLSDGVVSLVILLVKVHHLLRVLLSVRLETLPLLRLLKILTT